MSARAIWKGVLHLGKERVPVKLYSAVEDRSVRFRLLERASLEPVVQSLVNPETDEVVPFDAARRGFVTEDDELVVLEPDELAELEPEPSRDIEVLQFLPPEAIDHRWYDRPYYLGPDGDAEGYQALAAALERSGREGVARWVMRKQAYVGALRLHRGYPMLVTLRHEEAVLSIGASLRPQGKPLDERQLDMARKLLAMLEAPFEPTSYRDEYRERVLDLIEQKRAGHEPPAPPKRRKRRSRDLDQALEASLRAGGRRA
jgi:DNA end-binding protein Ku